MFKCYLVTLRLPEVGVLEREALRPVGTLIDHTGSGMGSVLPHIEVVAKRSYHQIQAQMDDPMTMDSEFHKFVLANRTEHTNYGDKLIGFFPVIPRHRAVSRSHTEDRLAKMEAYLVYGIEDNHILE